jgi:pimeloyl-ACP methyl ester carboxylesterase
VLEYVEYGDPDGTPVLFFPGTPSTARCGVLIEEASRRSRVRLLAVNRPGYAASTLTPPGLASVGRDAVELADALAVRELAVLGISGGGPFALATAAMAGSRVTRVLVAAGAAPMTEVSPDLLTPLDRDAIELMIGGDVRGAVAAMAVSAAADWDALRALPDAGVAEVFAAQTPNEHYFDDRRSEHLAFVADLRNALTTYDGYVRDVLSWGPPWDVDLGQVTSPVELAYGDHDQMVPAVNGEWLAARLPDARFTVHSGAGHGDMSFGHAEALFATLR